MGQSMFYSITRVFPTNTWM